MNAIKSVLDFLLRWLCIALFAVLVLVVCWQVFTRQVLQDPATWTTTAAQYLFVWLALFGSAYVFADRGHIAVDFMVRLLKISHKRYTEAFVQFIILLFAVFVLIWGGLRGVDLTWTQQVSGLPVSVGAMYLALPISGVLTAFYALFHLVEALRGRGLPDEFDEEIREAI
ncbi:TRAP-type C4-dicarboxylate transport system permease small subunit [Glutamicibacter mysorens]|uniref:TRAP-type C4-dicarboxylate transport system permease small subunit n=1 Tax=Glutamicibacter mysorens TaxID=257984 RepID=A0ABX4N1W1_9MICC|nr:MULTISPECIES: TRAP transporter small permease [Glutamicibacter]PJJ45633.1 TRAP-type C4-dicarboxylate transport system permease small subunit [Glutamicibacter mysorens]